MTKKKNTINNELALLLSELHDKFFEKDNNFAVFETKKVVIKNVVKHEITIEFFKSFDESKTRKLFNTIYHMIKETNLKLYILRFHYLKT